MKIGQVSKKYNLSVDNIYYYINYGLLVPKRKGGQYDFDAQTISDLEMVLELKQMSFSLKQIHQILSLYRISGLADLKDVEDLKAIYLERLKELLGEKVNLDRSINSLNEKINQLNNIIPQKRPESGLPLSMLDLLCCPNCGRSFDFQDISMNQRYIFSADLRCTCGYKAEIRNGILLTPNKNTDIYDKPDVDRDMYKDLPPSLISLFQKSYNWMCGRISEMDLAGKVVIETYVNAWCFLHNHQQDLDPRGKYIIVDKYPETLQMYKEIMEKQGYDLDILFIADSSTQFPLKHGCVDLCIDYFAVNEHNFYHDTFLYDELAPYFSEKAQMLGTYFYFEKGKRSMKKLMSEYPTVYERNFSLPYFLENMNRRIIQWEDCGYTTSSGNNIGFSFHCEGDKMYLRSYLAKYNE